MRNDSKSFKYNENKTGERFSPCLTPQSQAKKGEFSPFYGDTGFNTTVHIMYDSKKISIYVSI